MSDNPRAVIGGNNPPPFEQISGEIDDLCGEAALWLDGAKVDSQELADGIGNLLGMLRSAGKKAEDLRKAEKEPHLQAGRAVDERFKPLTQKITQASEACKAALQPWLAKIEADKRAAAEAARKEAEAAKAAAEAAIRSADAANLNERIQAEEMISAAKQADRAASRAEQQTATAGMGLGKAAHLRTYEIAAVTDPYLFSRWLFANHSQQIGDFLNDCAGKLVRAGKRDLPGVTITEEKRVA